MNEKLPYIVIVRICDFSNEDRERFKIIIISLGFKYNDESFLRLERIVNYVSLDLYILSKTVTFNMLCTDRQEVLVNIQDKGRRILVYTFKQFLTIMDYIKNPNHVTYKQYLDNCSK